MCPFGLHRYGLSFSTSVLREAILAGDFWRKGEDRSDRITPLPFPAYANAYSDPDTLSLVFCHWFYPRYGSNGYMKIKTTGAALVLLLALLPGIGMSADKLTWPATDLTIKADPKKPTTEAVFSFKNKSNQAVIIISTMPSCDCVQPVLAKEMFAPGEVGELRAVFTLGALTGRQEKTITVSYSDEAAAPTVLRLTVDIPEAPVRLSVSSVVWPQGFSKGTGRKRVDIERLVCSLRSHAMCANQN